MPENPAVAAVAVPGWCRIRALMPSSQSRSACFPSFPKPAPEGRSCGSKGVARKVSRIAPVAAGATPVFASCMAAQNR